ncbi:hypothetical protein [Campylobacter sp. RM16188]|uniref:DUF6115 domain-containing protein n=1 Tax=Campylobacter sp. RM16188 TaxID=1705725 RepID=UPI001552E000|nr:hypothetical protein [Campylobacter sp. RM16188]
MDNEILIYGGFGLVLLILFILIFVKDAEASKKFSRYEKVIESIIQENHLIKKQLKNIETSGIADLDAEEIEGRLEQRLNNVINSKITPIIKTLQSIEESIGNFQVEQQNRLYSLEERTKDINKISSFGEESDEMRIIDLYNTGKSIESIAKSLRVGVGKVELVLKLNRLI